MRTIIKKVKITKSRTLEVELTEIRDDGFESENTLKPNQLAHEDFINAFAKLVFHFAYLCDLRESDSMNDIENFNPQDYSHIKVNQFVITNEGDNEGVTLVGIKKMGTKVLSLNSPHQLYDDSDYMYANELAADIQACNYEVQQYLFEDKWAVKQMEIDFENQINDITITISEDKPKKRGKKKKEERSSC